MARQKASERRAAALAALEAAKRDVQELETKDAARIGKMAVRAGLADLDLDDPTLLREFQAVAARFRDGKAKPAGSGKGAPAADEPNAGAGANGGSDPGHPQ